MNRVIWKPKKSGGFIIIEIWNAIRLRLPMVNWYEILYGMLNLLPSNPTCYIVWLAKSGHRLSR